MGKAKKAVEVNWESMDRVRLFHDNYSIQDAAATHHTVDNPQHVHPPIIAATTATPHEAPSRADTRCTHYTHSTAPLAEGANMLGSQVQPSTVFRQSMLSGESSSPTQACNRMAGFECWPGEVALTYTLCMASVCIYGKTSLICKTALEGLGKDSACASFACAKGKEKRVVRNYGLLGLARFETGAVMDAEDEHGEQKTV